jgi:prepilin-type N-terminal cleavage/methylation domain-containing protein
MNTLLRPARAGFTLLEVLVSTAIMVIIVLTVVTIASDTLRVYDRSVAELSSQSEARGVLDAVENDFSTASLRSDGRCWMEVIIPGGAGAPTSPPSPAPVGNIHKVDQPIIMLFAAPLDRPRWNADATSRRQVRGDVCAVAYRIGHRSPFDMPGEKIQQIYGVYRTVVDSENTFNEALPVILDGPIASTMKTPWDYWSGSRTVSEFAPLTGASGPKVKTLIDGTLNCWTLDEQNFIGSNVVAMNMVLWCSSSLPSTSSPPSLRDPLLRVDSALRPVIPATLGETQKYNANPLIGGYGVAFKSATTPSTTKDAGLRYAPAGLPLAVAMPTAGEIHPKDYYFGRLRVFSNRMYPDTLNIGPTVSAAPLPYMPYTIRGVEISITILTPEGSKELRGLQQMSNQSTLTDTAAFRRIVYQHGRNFTRYVRVFANGG